MAEPLTVFLSYARESDEHQAWVVNLANSLDSRLDFHVVFDQYDLHAGKDLTNFMDRAGTCDRVVVVVSPTYIAKARDRRGGVGYESSVISVDVLKNQLSARVIPALRLGDEPPSFLASKIFVDFREDATFARDFNDLTAALLGLGPVARPLKVRDMNEDTLGASPSMSGLALGPCVVASLPSEPTVTEYFGPIEFENIGELDAFNVDIADLSNRSQLAKFARIPRLRPGEKRQVAPVIEGAKSTRNGMADLYNFAWVGKIGRAFELVDSSETVVPKRDIDEAVRAPFIAPIRVAYHDRLGREWVSYCELILGRVNSGRQHFRVEFRRVERGAS